MSNLEVITELRLKGKLAYLSVGMKQSTFSNTVKAIELRVAKVSTTEKFFKKFGYSGSYDNWNYNITEIL